MSQLRLCFAGTPEFAAQHLSCLIKHDFSIAAVYTQPDRPSGRGKKPLPSPVKHVALNAALPVKQPTTLRSDDAAHELRDLAPDLFIVVAYGLILPQQILHIPKYGCINVHASLLPRWRGAAPIERALLSGDKESGVTVMQMDAGLDTGPILHKHAVSIESGDDRLSLTEKLSKAGQQALVYSLENLNSLLLNAEKQDDSGVTYAEKITKDDSRIDWNNTAQEILNVVRAGVGRAPAFSLMEENRVRIIKAYVTDGFQNEQPGTVLDINNEYMEVMCKDTTIRITLLQLPGKNVISPRDYVNSNNPLIQVGSRFSNLSDNFSHP